MGSAGRVCQCAPWQGVSRFIMHKFTNKIHSELKNLFQDGKIEILSFRAGYGEQPEVSDVYIRTINNPTGEVFESCDMENQTQNGYCCHDSINKGKGASV